MTTSEAVSGIVEALKTQPLSLALVIMNLALLALFYFIVQSAEHRTQVRADEMKHMIELLANCRGTLQ